MRWVTDERGATAVTVALLMVPLLGFAAIAIDVGALYAEQRQLQNGADAGALAVAQDCAQASAACAARDLTAETFAANNANDGSAEATTALVGANSVRVETSTENDNPNGVTGVAHYFAPILGVESSTVAATASAAWGAPSSGPAIFPFVFSSCELGLGFDVPLSIGQQDGTDTCAGPFGGNVVPGGFGWLTPGGGCTSVPIVVGGSAIGDGSPGASAPAGCLDILEKRKGETLLFPVFDKVTGSGSGASYSVYGFAAFRIAGWRFPSSRDLDPAYPTCNKCVQGVFEEFVTVDDAFEYTGGAPDLGASVVGLTS